ncbi:MAG: DUF2867 domain-containing protein [Gemmatimonadales bacterium]|nr:DUF2867 domain-containing protein [Gemmatimonadales bacterium]
MTVRPGILLTGATGYVGGRLLPLLRKRGHPVRCLARRPEFLRDQVPEGTEVVRGDVLDRTSLDGAMAGIDTAYYLVHSMGSGGDFEDQDRLAAEHFARAASEAGVRRIIYLGGLGESDADLSAHLESRQEVGKVLRAHSGQTQVIEFRASIIIGSGSASFEMIRALVERLPAMVTPRWVSVMAQPIAIDDVLAYLVAALDLELPGPQVYDIGGRDQVSYREIMMEYASQRGLRRLMIPVPVLTPRLSSLWLGLVTPLYARVGRRLIDSMRHPTVVRDNAARLAFDIAPRSTAEAIALALRNEDRERAGTAWSGAVSAASTPREWGGVRFGNRLVDSRSVWVAAAPARAFAPVEQIGGGRGWYAWNGLWRVRGWIDLLLGGVGMRRGRQRADRLGAGDVVDCWRVEVAERPARLLLAAEMKLPGRAWLEFAVEAEGEGSRIRQTAIFDPVGLSGLVYWYAAWGLHQLVFRDMLSGIAREAVRPA